MSHKEPDLQSLDDDEKHYRGVAISITGWKPPFSDAQEAAIQETAVSIKRYMESAPSLLIKRSRQKKKKTDQNRWGDAGSDRAALLYLMGRFDAETIQCPRCGGAEDTADMDSADWLRKYLSTHPEPSR